MSTISVLVPIYFKENTETVKKSLVSMALQTVKPDEIVCVLDEPSTPEIEENIDAFSLESGIKIVKCYCKRGSGLGSVLNLGVANCSCDYIARMDADDVAIPERLEKERDFLEQHKDIDVVGSNIAEFDNCINEIIAFRNVPEHDTDCKKMLKNRDPINHMTAMFRRSSVLKAGNYSSEMKSCEDTYLWTSFYAAGLNFANIQDNLVFVHAGREMYERRSGKKAYYYVKKAIEYKQRVGLINGADAFFQKIVNYCVLILMNNGMRAFIYENLLRKRKWKMDESNPIIMLFVNSIKHYNHKKYWNRRIEVINPNSKYPKFIRLYWLLWIKRCDAFNNASMGTGYGRGAAFSEPPKLPHLLNGIIVSYGAKIGRNCTINQQVTIGQNEKGHPVIGDNVFIGAGARIIGAVTIGDNVKIGANAVVVKDIPGNSTVVGVPGVIVKKT